MGRRREVYIPSQRIDPSPQQVKQITMTTQITNGVGVSESPDKVVIRTLTETNEKLVEQLNDTRNKLDKIQEKLITLLEEKNQNFLDGQQS
jgi:hypothetical protein